ncbi:hypothetical protein ADK64_37055 [Streptomyces sp. MMG1121]|nr:hypothetical protein ADK64_37055 [Streptomyces sp. MMG1121]
MFAPLPPVGEVAWMASPSSVTGPGAQRSRGSTTRMDSRVLLSGSACSMSACRFGCQPSILDSAASCAVKVPREPFGGRIMAQRT